jgi:hypothetical protein
MILSLSPRDAAFFYGIKVGYSFLLDKIVKKNRFSWFRAGRWKFGKNLILPKQIAPVGIKNGFTGGGSN